jgi:hypothetical protein
LHEAAVAFVGVRALEVSDYAAEQKQNDRDSGLAAAAAALVRAAALLAFFLLFFHFSAP